MMYVERGVLILVIIDLVDGFGGCSALVTD
jgi:hypothetical protein